MMGISVKNVSKLYGTQKALDQVSFELKKGEIVGFLGPNGAGKSTMMKIMACYIPATSGTVTVEGLNVETDAEAIKQIIGYLPEHNPLYLDMYVKEYLTYVAETYKMKAIKATVDAIIEKTGLTLEQHKKIEALSKGYRQRVGIAQALIHDPKVIILDEPTTGLDPNQLVDIRKLFKTIAQDRIVLFSSHIMQEVEELCDRVMIINKGQLVANEPIERLKQHFRTASLLIEFDQDIQEIETLKRIKGITTIELVTSTTIKIFTDNEQEVKKALLQWAIEKGLSVRSLNNDSQKLEHIFHAFTHANTSTN